MVEVIDFFWVPSLDDEIDRAESRGRYDFLPARNIVIHEANRMVCESGGCFSKDEYKAEYDNGESHFTVAQDYASSAVYELERASLQAIQDEIASYVKGFPESSLAMALAAVKEGESTVEKMIDGRSRQIPALDEMIRILCRSCGDPDKDSDQ